MILGFAVRVSFLKIQCVVTDCSSRFASVTTLTIPPPLPRDQTNTRKTDVILLLFMFGTAACHKMRLTECKHLPGLIWEDINLCSREEPNQLNHTLAHTSPQTASVIMSSLDQIVTSLNNVYSLFVRMGYLTADRVLQPPHNDTDLDIELCRELGMNHTAINFIKQLPWAKFDDENAVDFIVDSSLNYFANQGDLRASRGLSTTNEGVTFQVSRELNGCLFSLTDATSASGKRRRGKLLVVNASHGEQEYS